MMLLDTEFFPESHPGELEGCFTCKRTGEFEPIVRRIDGNEVCFCSALCAAIHANERISG